MIFIVFNIYIIRKQVQPNLKKEEENLPAQQRIFMTVISVPIKDFSTILSKITKYNRIHLGGNWCIFLSLYLFVLCALYMTIFLECAISFCW